MRSDVLINPAASSRDLSERPTAVLAPLSLAKPKTG